MSARTLATAALKEADRLAVKKAKLEAAAPALRDALAAVCETHGRNALNGEPLGGPVWSAAFALLKSLEG